MTFFLYTIHGFLCVVSFDFTLCFCAGVYGVFCEVDGFGFMMTTLSEGGPKSIKYKSKCLHPISYRLFQRLVLIIPPILAIQGGPTKEHAWEMERW